MVEQLNFEKFLFEFSSESCRLSFCSLFLNFTEPHRNVIHLLVFISHCMLFSDFNTLFALNFLLEMLSHTFQRQLRLVFSLLTIVLEMKRKFNMENWKQKYSRTCSEGNVSECCVNAPKFSLKLASSISKKFHEILIVFARIYLLQLFFFKL